VADLSANWDTPGVVCQSEAAFPLNNLLSGDATTGGSWTIDGNPSTQFDPSSLTEGDHTVNYRVIQEPCTVESSQIISIVVPLNPGVAGSPAESCSNESVLINLETLLEGESAGGIWSSYR